MLSIRRSTGLLALELVKSRSVGTDSCPSALADPQNIVIKARGAAAYELSGPQARARGR